MTTADGQTRIEARAVIICGGRFGMISSHFDLSDTRLIFRRVEVGLRIEQPADAFFLREDSWLDSKFICSSTRTGASWRTFCCCRDGELITTNFRGWQTFSGRADGPATGRSNIGFNLRYGDSATGRRTWSRIRASIEGAGRAFQAPLHSLVGESRSSAGRELAELYGAEASRDLRLGLIRLCQDFEPGSFMDATVHGPTPVCQGELRPVVHSKSA
ncbi:hypothetical protein [Winogradskya humida]|uniref:hypothetical protein n=2 Tax=Winogradskya humida TaxID=113566 RepID=UPI0031DCD1A3